MKGLLLLVGAMIVLCAAAFGTMWHVDMDNTSGIEDGTPWATAFTVIQDPVDIASSGDEVWVAEGTYPESITIPESRPMTGPKAGEVRAFEGGEFAWVPAGTFEMGSELSAERVESTYGGQAQWYKLEHPQHTVTLTKGFWMGRYEVTNQEFELFGKETGYKTEAEREGWGYGWIKDTGKWDRVNGISWRNPGYAIQPKHPVALVSWHDAVAYCRWLSRKTGGRYRLPTEAEWEYACRAGTRTEYQWGDAADDGRGWLNGGDQTEYEGQCWPTPFNFEDGYWFAAPVGSFKANAWGLYDMHGNVWEWCHDWFAVYPSGPATDPQGPSTGTHRVGRGGGWSEVPGFCRSAARDGVAPDHRYGSMGFRLCRH